MPSTHSQHSEGERGGRRHQQGRRGGNEFHRRDQRGTTMSFVLQTRGTIENWMRCEVEEWMKCDGVALSGRGGGVVMLATICFRSATRNSAC